MKRITLIKAATACVLAVFSFAAVACTPQQIAQYERDHDVHILPGETPTVILGRNIVHEATK